MSPNELYFDTQNSKFRGKFTSRMEKSFLKNLLTFLSLIFFDGNLNYRKSIVMKNLKNEYDLISYVKIALFERYSEKLRLSRSFNPINFTLCFFIIYEHIFTYFSNQTLKYK